MRAESTYEHVTARLDGVTLHVVQAGPKDGPALILLHGFPEFWLEYRAYIDPFVRAGYRVIVPDQRGYNLSDKPAATEDYRLDRLATDIFRLADAMQCGPFALVGHDWGASVAWSMATLRPHSIERMAVINGAHPAVWLRAIKGDPEQRRKSGYGRFLRVRHLPELLIKAGRYQGLANSINGGSSMPALGPEVLAEYHAAWRRKGALTGMLNWYRANLGEEIPLPADQTLSTPTLILWGDQDQYACSYLAEQSAALCRTAHIVHFPRAGHWVIHEQPNEILAQLLSWFCAAPASRESSLD